MRNGSRPWKTPANPGREDTDSTCRVWDLFVSIPSMLLSSIPTHSINAHNTDYQCNIAVYI